MFGDRLTEIGFLMVAAPDDPLASFDGMIKHVQLALTDRSELSTVCLSARSRQDIRLVVQA